MPSRSRARGLTLQPVVLDDLFEDVVEIDHGEEDDSEEEEEEDEGEEETDDDQGSEDGEGSSEEEEEEDEEGERHADFAGGDCGPSAQARVSGAAAERPTCPVCMDPWTSQGPHRISCIPCGHVYGRSCLERWLTQRRSPSATCPQCGKRFKQKDIINLYAPEVAIPKNELEKEISYLRERNDSLENKVLQHDKLFEEMTKVCLATFVGLFLCSNSGQKKVAEHSDGAARLELSTSATVNFGLQNELFLDGARVIAIDASNQLILASGRATAVGPEYVLTKISMNSTEAQKIHLPPDTKTVKDMCILPGGSAIFTSLGRRLSLFSMTTDSVVLQCDLPVPGWSCSADVSGSHHIYAGLQNGMLLVFDIRLMTRPLHSMVGLSMNPIHTLHSVIDNNGCRKILSASAVGPCMWDADDSQSRPHLLAGTNNQRVCISLACAPPSSDVFVASFRPKVEASEDATTSQVYLSQTPSRPIGSGKLGHHALLRRTGNSSFAEGTTCYGNVSEIRMSRSAIIPYGDNHQEKLFAYGDESLRGVRTWQLPSFAIHSDLCPHRQPILDLRYAESSGGGTRYLGCLSDEKLQVFRVG
ncbi:hypothetical protein HU200_001947 [Digitaria exilis]|uniref:RING-type E3 ubiquitin transferase n=1 Tax=Digitaria exilis TaxID=1010633 RepID=A0A835FZD3_9POAL|nr:hypothetical protein HU200_001947 [Digitaria exilis]